VAAMSGAVPFLTAAQRPEAPIQKFKWHSPLVNTMLRSHGRRDARAIFFTLGFSCTPPAGGRVPLLGELER